jgi:hypothetical protein
VLVPCPVVPIVCARFARLHLGYATGMYAGSQTISATILTGKPAQELFRGLRMFVERVRRGDQIIEAAAQRRCRQGT